MANGATALPTIPRLPSSTTRVHFRVQLAAETPLEAGQFIAVSGSCDQLGRWLPRAGLPLTRSEVNQNEWCGLVEVEGVEQFHFRYFIAYRLHEDSGDALVINRWESFLRPRSVLIAAETRNGECRLGHLDKFGYFAGSTKIQDGWLDDESENQILLRIHGKALKFYKAGLESKMCMIKVQPLDVRQWQQQLGSVGDDVDDLLGDGEEMPIAGQSPSHSKTLVASLTSDSRPAFRTQSEKGEPFVNDKDYIVFRTHSVAVEFLAFHLEISWSDGRVVGQCYALPASLFDTFGATTIAFINPQGRPVGQITVEYLFIRPLRCPAPPQTLAVSYAKHWKKRNTLEVGHRGMGNSYTKFAAARENTIHSLNAAAKNGADFVEFDVQLTKDKIAVIYHDFHVLISVARKKSSSVVDLSSLQAQVTPPGSKSLGAGDNVEYHEIAVKDLKLSQLKLLQLDHVTGQVTSVSKLGDIEESEDLRPFPTLVEAFERVDPDVGFNIEVKYPMMQKDGLHECANYFERNLFVDIILSDVLLHAGQRRIMFSSFDPDICSLISMKQNLYPVLFLCVGETTRYEPFQDQRSSTSMTAVNFAAGADILGVDFNSEDLLKDPTPVHRARELGLITFVWGDDLNDRVHANYFKKELAVDGIIYDRIGEEERRQNVFTVEREQKRAIFLASGSSTPVRATSTESMTSLPGHLPVHNGLTSLLEAAPGDREASAADGDTTPPPIASLSLNDHPLTDEATKKDEGLSNGSGSLSFLQSTNAYVPATQS